MLVTTTSPAPPRPVQGAGGVPAGVGGAHSRPTAAAASAKRARGIKAVVKLGGRGRPGASLRNGWGDWRAPPEIGGRRRRAAVGALRPGGPLSRQHHAGTALLAAGPLLGVRRGGAQRPRIGRVRLVRGP